MCISYAFFAFVLCVCSPKTEMEVKVYFWTAEKRFHFLSPLIQSGLDRYT